MDSLHTIQLTPPGVVPSISKQLGIFGRNERHRTIWDDAPDQKTTTTTLWGTMDWSLVTGSLLLLIFSSLLIANGNCSQPHGLSANLPVCIGGHLSVQSWLAIVGLEFGALGFIIMPRIQAVLTSKILTSRLMDKGLPLARLLNTQNTAPIYTQLRLGMKSILFLKILFSLIIATFSILYKFSFDRVPRFVSIGLPDTTSPILMGCNNGGCEGISTNLIDALANTNTPSSFNTSFSPKSNMTALHYEQVYGPSQVNIGHQLNEGNLFLCTPTYYSRNTIVPNSPDWTPPKLGKTPYNKGVRYSNTSDGTVMDVFSLNSTLYVLTGIFSANGSARYTSFLRSSTQVCLGFASWSVNNTAGRTPFLQNPTDIACIPAPFIMGTWINATSTQFTRSLLEGLGSKSINNLPASTAMLNVILATLNYTSYEVQLAANHTAVLASSTLPQALPACALSSSSARPWVVVGTIPLHGTGMTILGDFLQGFIVLLSLLTLLLLFWPTLPLVGEWPAQWLGLIYGLSPGKVQEAVEGTSVGRNEAGGRVRVWLGSGGGDVLEGRPWLMLGEDQGRVRMGRGHV